MDNSTGGWAALSGNPLAVALVAAIVGFALGALTIYVSFLTRRYTTAKWNHKAAFLDLVKNPREGDHPARYDGRDLYTPPFRWAEPDPTATKMLAHLRASPYMPVAAAVAKAKAAHAAYVVDMKGPLTEFQSRVDLAVGTVPGLTEQAGNFLGPGVGYYSLIDLRKVLFEDLRQRCGGGYFPPVDVAIIPNSNGVLGRTDYTIVWPHAPRLGEGTKDQMDRLLERILPLITDGDLRMIVERVEKADHARLSDSSLGEFETERSNLVERLDSKQEALAGRCQVCPPFLGIQPRDPGTN